MTNKPSRLEQEYFAGEEIEKLHRLSEEKHHSEMLHDKAEHQSLHHMKCPRCGQNLHTVRHQFVDIDECKSCGVIVLGKEELDEIIKAESSILRSFVDIFRKG